MRAFIFGVIFTVVAIFVVVLIVAQFGLFPTNADVTPSGMERHMAMTALDASMEHHAPQIPNPVPVTDQNLIDGIKLYTMNCALCHGTLDYKPSVLEHSMYPPPPQLILDPMDDPEWHIYYAIRTGVRYTGNAGLEQSPERSGYLEGDRVLSHIDKLPPEVQQYWKSNFGVAPQSHAGEGGHDRHD